MIGVSGLIATTAICAQHFEIFGLHQYYIVAFLYAIFTFFLHNLIYDFFAQAYYINKKNKELSVEATYDSLTYCQNRLGLKIFFENLPADKTMAVAMLDIDDFKLYNDKFSHQAGDETLSTIALTIKDLYLQDPNFPFFRYGGDEFLLFYDISDEETLTKELLRVQKAIHDLNLQAPPGAPADHATLSIGACLFSTKDPFDQEGLLKRVDSQLYQCKDAGKDCITVENKTYRID